jgi:hypothetical protein
MTAPVSANGNSVRTIWRIHVAFDATPTYDPRARTARRFVNEFPQALDQLANGLRQSLREHDVYDQNRNPAVRVEMAAAELTLALRRRSSRYTGI